MAVLVFHKFRKTNKQAKLFSLSEKCSKLLWTLDSEHYCCCVFQKQVYAPGALSWLFLTWIKSCSCLKPGTLHSFPRRSKVSVFIVIFNKVDSKRDFLDFKGESVTQTECGMLSPARTESILAAVWDVPGFRWTLHELSEQCNRNKSFTRLYLLCKEILGFQLEQLICYLEGWRFNPWRLECPQARRWTSGFSDVLNGVWMLDTKDQHECVSHGWKRSARVEKHYNKNQSVYSKQAVRHFPLYYISKVCATIFLYIKDISQHIVSSWALREFIRLSVCTLLFTGTLRPVSVIQNH